MRVRIPCVPREGPWRNGSAVGSYPISEGSNPSGPTSCTPIRDRLAGRTLGSEPSNAGSTPAPGTEAEFSRRRKFRGDLRRPKGRSKRGLETSRSAFVARSPRSSRTRAKGDVRPKGALFFENLAPIKCDVSDIAHVVREHARAATRRSSIVTRSRTRGLAIIPAWPNGRAPGC